jgi:hypothetical protein
VSQGGAVKGNTDPRVGGAKIIFDSRLDKFSTPQQSRDYIRQKQKELPPYTLDDKKQALIKMLSSQKKDTVKPENTEVSVDKTSRPA